MVSFFVSRSLEVKFFIHLSQNDKYSQHKILISKIIKLYFLNDRYMISEVPYLFYLTKKNQNKMSDLRTSDFFVK